MNSFPAANYILGLVFVLSVCTVGIGALIAVLSTRLIRSVAGLAVCCFGLAGLYYFLHSPFLALMEILIYVGAVCITIIFAVMLAEPDEPRHEAGRRPVLWGGVALLVSGTLFWGLYRLGTSTVWAQPERVNSGSLKDIGFSLLTTYSMAFEMISLALLVAIVGALAIARMGRTRTEA